MMTRRRWRSGALLVLTISVVVACSSVDSDPGVPGTPAPDVTATAPVTRPPSRVETEVARASIGPAGGTVSGAGATIEVPEGALEAETTIVIKTLDPLDVTLPLRGRLAGNVYAFEPDDVAFLKPVKVTVAVSPPSSGRGIVFLLRSPKALSNWEVKGGGPATQTFVDARTDRFSDWAPVVMDEYPCLLDLATCPADVGDGIDCAVPAASPSVHCTGSAGAYACTCFGQTAVIATFDEVPSPSALSSLALACGTACEDLDLDAGAEEDASIEEDSGSEEGGTSTCEPVVSCETWTDVDGGDDADASEPDAEAVGPEPGWRCTTLSTTRSLSCRHVHGTTTATCRCGPDEETPPGDDDGAPEFTIAATDEPPSAESFASAWREHCTGQCIEPTLDAGADGAACVELDDGGCAPDGGPND